MSHYDVTLHVHSHTPIQEFAEPDADYTNRRTEGCLGISSLLTRTSGRYSEPWFFITSDINDCAVMDIIYQGGNLDGADIYTLYFKRRVDYQAVAPGYLSSRSEEIDERSSQSAYLSATTEQVSTWAMRPYDDGFLIYQDGNSNVSKDQASFNSEGWYLLAGMDADAWYDEYRTDLLLHGGQNGEYKLQTIFTIGDEDKASMMTFSSLALVATALFSMY